MIFIVTVYHKIGKKLIRKMSNDFGPKRLCVRPHSDGNDKSYFDSYADITVHEEMLSDEIRTNAYKKAIFDCADQMKNKVVLDVGAGTGILSCFCAKAGARKVFAVEASDIAKQARKVVELNGLQDKIEVFQCLLEDVKLPEKVDFIVSEWMGYCLLYESMLSSVLTARDRWLKEGGRMLPCEAVLYLAPICDNEIIVEKVNFWNDMSDCYGVDMSCIKEFARSSMAKDVMVKTISCENVLSHPTTICTLDLYTVRHQHVRFVAGHFAMRSFGIADLQGFALWFDVTFPAPDSTGYRGNHVPPPPPTSDHGRDAEPQRNGHHRRHLVLSTSPYAEETHWKQSVLYLEREVEVAQDTLLEGRLELTPCRDNPRFLNLRLACRVDGGKETVKSYLMGYETPPKYGGEGKQGVINA